MEVLMGENKTFMFAAYLVPQKQEVHNPTVGESLWLVGCI